MTVYYANLSNGLRGCYMPDNATPIKFSTRSELKTFVQDEANAYRDAGYVGASKVAIAAMVQSYWKRIGGNNHGKPRKPVGYLETVLPLKPAHSDSYSIGIFLSPLSRAEYKQACADLD